MFPMYHKVANKIRRRRQHQAEQIATVGRVKSYDMNLSDEAGQAAAVVENGGFWTGQARQEATRMIAVARPYRPQRVLDFVRESLQSARETWHYNSLVELHDGFSRLLDSSDLREIDYYLMCWPSGRGSGRNMLKSAAGHFGTPVEETIMPALFGDYVDRGSYLEPLDGHGPYLALYTVYELVGSYRPTTIHQVLQKPSCPVAMAIDIENLGPRAKQTLETAYNTLSSGIKSQLQVGSTDPHAQAAIADVIRAQAALEENQTLHYARIVLMIQAPTLELLAEYGAQLAADLNTIMKLRQEPGKGAELLKYFAPIHRRKIRVALESLPLLSVGCGVLAGQYGYAAHHESRGLLLGIDSRSSNPILYSLWEKAEQKGANALFLGKIGSGKTYTMEDLIYRAATVLDTQAFVLDVLGNFVGLPLALGEGAYYCQIGLGAGSLNLLDIVYPESSIRQNQYVIQQLALLMGSGEDAAGGDGTLRRSFTDPQKAALDLVLTALYEPIWDDPQAVMPLMQNLCDRLEDLGDEKEWPGVAALGRELRRLFVDSSLGAVFNRHSTIPTHFPNRVYVFDVSEVDAYASVIYMQLMTIFKRYARSPQRTRPLLIVIDEFKTAAKDAIVAQAAVDLTKVGRNLQVGVWTSDQDISSYFMTKQAQQMLANLALVYIGRQEGEDVEDVMRIFHNLTLAHKRRMLRATTGQFIVRADDNYHFIDFETTGRELYYFGGKRAERRRRLLEHTRQQASERQLRGVAA